MVSLLFSLFILACIEHTVFIPFPAQMTSLFSHDPESNAHTDAVRLYVASCFSSGGVTVREVILDTPTVKDVHV